jgi:predicted GNAT superfamily acetyltransferase
VLQTSLLVTIQRYGGLLLGARDEAGRMIGVLLGLPGIKEGKVVHCSHLLGILPEWRSKHVGYRMKTRQRDFVLAQCLDLIVWTFDPLETRNAHLNLGYLGGICREYNPNLYGIMNDNFNHSMESDRLTVSWYIRHPKVEARLAGRRPAPRIAALLASGTPILTHCVEVESEGNGESYVKLTEPFLGQHAPVMLVEVPSNFQAIKRLDNGDARTWRYGARAILQDLFARGYAILDLLVDAQAGRLTRCYYLVGMLEAFLEGGQATIGEGIS